MAFILYVYKGRLGYYLISLALEITVEATQRNKVL